MVYSSYSILLKSCSYLGSSPLCFLDHRQLSCNVFGPPSLTIHGNLNLVNNQFFQNLWRNDNSIHSDWKIFTLCSRAISFKKIRNYLQAYMRRSISKNILCNRCACSAGELLSSQLTMRSFFFIFKNLIIYILGRYNWYITLCKFKVYNMLIWYRLHWYWNGAGPYGPCSSMSSAYLFCVENFSQRVSLIREMRNTETQKNMSLELIQMNSF